MAPEAVTPRPPADPWTAAIYVNGSNEVRGTGVVVGPTRIVTCAHVVWAGNGWFEQVSVAFPKAHVGLRHRQSVARVLPAGWDQLVDPDIAVLELDEPVPTSVRAARLRFPVANDLFDLTWWAFGFPGGHRAGGDAAGVLGTSLADGMIRLRTRTADQLASGFSGSGVWSPDYDAVIGIVVNAGDGDHYRGDGQALTLSFADHESPDLKIRASWSLEDVDEATRTAWGWSLTNDPERGRHWSPRSRGVAAESDRGFHFRGRTRALTDIVEWLDHHRPTDCPLIVTGSPGVGKSAVLGRIVTTADADVRRHLPINDTAVRATAGSVHCAVHVKDKTALEVTREIAKAASVTLPDEPSHLVQALWYRLSRHPARFNLVVDALDEAVTPADTRLLIEILRDLIRHCAVFGVRVIAGTRRRDDAGGDLIGLFGPATIIDLDDPVYFAEEDLVSYAVSTLQLAGAERPANPYQDLAVAEPVARRIAALSGLNFLVAGLVARGHGLHDTVAAEPTSLAFAPTVDASLDRYLSTLDSSVRMPAGHAVPARLALTVLAYADAPGLPVALWQAGIAALGGSATEAQLTGFARTLAANFLIETGVQPSYRLFHQALNESLIRGRERDGYANDNQRIFAAFYAYGAQCGWPQAPSYLLRSLSRHATQPADIETLLADNDFIAHTDLARLVRAADGTATTPLGRARETLLRRTPQAFGADAGVRAAMFSVTQCMDQLPSAFETPATAPYVAVWAKTAPRQERSVLEGHTDAVRGLCAVRLRDRALLASAGEDGTVRLWDPHTAQQERLLHGHDDTVRAICALRTASSSLIVSASDDGVLVVWDADTGRLTRRLTGHAGWIRSICAVEHGGTTLLASVSDDRTVRLWDPTSGEVIAIAGGQLSWVTAVCAVSTAHGTCLAWGTYGGTITLWHVGARQPLRTMDGRSWITGLTPLDVGDRSLLASGGYDGVVRLWDVETGDLVHAFDPVGLPITGLCATREPATDPPTHSDRDAARVLIVASIDDGTVRAWDAGATTSAPVVCLDGHAGPTRGICTISIDGRELVASAGDDGTVRLWDTRTGELDRILHRDVPGPVPAICAIRDPDAPDRELVAAALRDGSVRMWRAETGVDYANHSGHYGQVTDVCAIDVDGQQRLASAGMDAKVRVRDPATGDVIRTLRHSGGWVAGLCSLAVPDTTLLATSGHDHVIRLWDLDAGVARHELHGHGAWIAALVAYPSGTGQGLASASHDTTVRQWDPYTGSLVRVLKGHHGAVTSIAVVADNLVTGSADHTVRLWQCSSGEPLALLRGHRAEVTSVCALRLGGTDLVASGSRDRTVRIWDPHTGAAVFAIPVHNRVLSCRQIGGHLIVGLSNGILAIRLADQRSH